MSFKNSYSAQFTGQKQLRILAQNIIEVMVNDEEYPHQIIKSRVVGLYHLQLKRIIL
jgi:hypothetical protein